MRRSPRPQVGSRGERVADAPADPEELLGELPQAVAVKVFRKYPRGVSRYWTCPGFVDGLTLD